MTKSERSFAALGLVFGLLIAGFSWGLTYMFETYECYKTDDVYIMSEDMFDYIPAPEAEEDVAPKWGM